MDAIIVARARLNEDLAARQHAARITLNDFIVRAAALALRDVPAANLRRASDGVEVAPGVDVALVVATEAGPRTPVVRDADRKGLAVLSEEIRTLVASARSGSAPAQPETDGTLSITSFARFGIESAYPMLPQDQNCVLGVGAVLEQPVVRSRGARRRVDAVPDACVRSRSDRGRVGGGVLAASADTSKIRSA